MSKNECGKTRPKTNPYEVWRNGSWTWNVLKKYQSPEKEASNPYARWFCSVVTPMCPNGELGDAYVADIKNGAYRIDGGRVDHNSEIREFIERAFNDFDSDEDIDFWGDDFDDEDDDE